MLQYRSSTALRIIGFGLVATPRRETGPGDDPAEPIPEQVEALRDEVVDAVARRMLDALAAGQSVPWCGGATLRPAGVRVGSTLLPWAAVRERADQSTGNYALLGGDGRRY